MNEFVEKLIERLEKNFKYNSEQAEIWRDGSDKDSYFREKKDLYLDRANIYGETIRIVKDLAAEYNDGWIPCSERLPNKEECRECNGQFIVSDGNRSFATYFDIYDTLKFGEPTIEGFRIDKCVIAWQPLPKPYREKGDNKCQNSNRAHSSNGGIQVIVSSRGCGNLLKMQEELREFARIGEMEHQREVMGIFQDDDLDGIRYAIESMLPSIEGLKEFGIELQEELDELGPSPAEIKKRLKYAKNPMEIKKLNQELTVAYKRYKGGSRNGIERR